MTYAERKGNARNEAIDWQIWAAENPMSWGELFEWQQHFENLGKRYGLLKEFRENGVC